MNIPITFKADTPEGVCSRSMLQAQFAGLVYTLGSIVLHSVAYYGSHKGTFSSLPRDLALRY